MGKSLAKHEGNKHFTASQLLDPPVNIELGTANLKEVLARFGGGPEAVAGKISKALTARRPSTRYKVTPSARMVMGMHGLMTDRMWDSFVRSQYPPPTPEA